MGDKDVRSMEFHPMKAVEIEVLELELGRPEDS